MRRSFLLAGLALFTLALGVGCSDSFNPPPLPDLGKVPYDFSVVVPPFMSDMGIGDLSTSD